MMYPMNILDTFAFELSDGSQDKNAFHSTISLSDEIKIENNIGRGYAVLYYEGEGTTYSHPLFGDFTVNRDVLEEMKANYDENVVGQRLAINYSHERAGKASGWVVAAYLSEDKKQLLYDIEWTPTAARAIRDKEYAYFSAEFSSVYRNSMSKKSYKNVLTGGALTNIPFLKKTNVTLNEGETKELSMDKDQMIKALSESHGINIVALQEEVKSKNIELSEVTIKLADSEKKLAELESKTLEKGREGIYEKALSEGKVLPAQKAMFMRSIGSISLSEAEAEVSNLPVVLKKEATASTGGDVVVDANLSEGDAQVAKIKEIAKEKNISFHEAANHFYMQGVQ